MGLWRDERNYTRAQHTHTDRQTDTHTQTHTHIYIYIHTNIYIHIYACALVHIHIYIYIYTGWNDKIVALEKRTWFHFYLMKTGFLFFFLLQTIYKLASCVQIPRVIGIFYNVWKWHNDERDWKCTAVQRMLSTDQSYDNRTIASTLKMQIWIPTNNRDVPRVTKTKLPPTVIIFTNPSVQAGYDTWSIFKRSLTGLNSEYSFS